MWPTWWPQQCERTWLKKVKTPNSECTRSYHTAKVEIPVKATNIFSATFELWITNGIFRIGDTAVASSKRRLTSTGSSLSSTTIQPHSANDHFSQEMPYSPNISPLQTYHITANIYSVSSKSHHYLNSSLNLDQLSSFRDSTVASAHLSPVMPIPIHPKLSFPIILTSISTLSSRKMSIGPSYSRAAGLSLKSRKIGCFLKMFEEEACWIPLISCLWLLTSSWSH